MPFPPGSLSSLFDSKESTLFSNARIVVVDDNDVSRMVIEKILRGVGVQHILVAENGVQALEMVQEIKPSMVVLDLMMPEMDGFEFCLQLRKMPEFASLPVLVQSGVMDSQQINQAFQCGASDYISKPINADEMLARVRVHLANQFLINDLQLYRNRVQQELQSAREMQMALMPSEDQLVDVKKHYQLATASYFQPSSELGGDFWGVLPVSDHEIGVYSVDIAGHGVTAALNTFRLHTIMQQMAVYSHAPNIYLAHVNHAFNKVVNVGQYATMFYGVINMETNQMAYCGAGAPFPILIRADGKIEQVQANGVPIGVLSETEYEKHTVDLGREDTLVVYSDALIETGNQDDEFMPLDYAASIVQKHIPKGVEEALQQLLDGFDTYTGGAVVSDDLTINLYHRLT